MQVIFTVEHPDAWDPFKKERILNERVQVSVKEEFVKKYPNCKEKTFKQLIVEYPIFEALDNDSFAAVKSLTTDTIRWYFKNGRMLGVGSDELKEIKHKESFNENVDSILKG